MAYDNARHGSERGPSVTGRIAAFFVWISRRFLYWLGLIVVVLPYEGAMRLWYHLDPRVWREDRRITTVEEGRMARKSGTYVLFVLYARHHIPAFTRTLLDAIARSDINLVVVSNGELSSGLRDELLGRTCLLIERVNLGRDFGAYKDGLSVLQARFADMDRVILMNDSVYYFENGLDAMLGELRGSADLIGTTETFEFHYHIQSFILSFSRALLDNPRFRQFWKSYRPISTRRWSIHKGEVGFTRRMMKAGIRPHILYHAPALGNHLRSQTAREILMALNYLPSFWRRKLQTEFDALTQKQMVSSRANVAFAGRSLQFLNSEHDSTVQDIATAVKDTLSANTDYQRWQLDGFVDAMIALIAKLNQCHNGGFLFTRHLKMPFAKRDLFLREVYTLPEIYDVLGEFHETMRDEIMADLRQRGSGAELKGLKRTLHSYGAI